MITAQWLYWEIGNISSNMGFVDNSVCIYHIYRLANRYHLLVWRRILDVHPSHRRTFGSSSWVSSEKSLILPHNSNWCLIRIIFSCHLYRTPISDGSCSNRAPRWQTYFTWTSLPGETGVRLHWLKQIINATHANCWSPSCIHLLPKRYWVSVPVGDHQVASNGWNGRLQASNLLILEGGYWNYSNGQYPIADGQLRSGRPGLIPLTSYVPPSDMFSSPFRY